MQEVLRALVDMEANCGRNWRIQVSTRNWGVDREEKSRRREGRGGLPVSLDSRQVQQGVRAAFLDQR